MALAVQDALVGTADSDAQRVTPLGRLHSFESSHVLTPADAVGPEPTAFAATHCPGTVDESEPTIVAW